MAPRLVAYASTAQIQSFLLARLYRAVALSRQVEWLVPANQRLLRGATFSFYCDCVAAGIGERARQVIALEGMPGASGAPRRGA